MAEPREMTNAEICAHIGHVAVEEMDRNDTRIVYACLHCDAQWEVPLSKWELDETVPRVDCPVCTESWLRYGFLPVWCEHCGTRRDW